jgi:RNA polymerase sigma-70 factor, ECF subfamily
VSPVLQHVLRKRSLEQAMPENINHRGDLFNERFVACQDHLYGYIASLLPRRDDADEVFQETSLKLLQNRSKYDPGRPFNAWAFAIALNEVRVFVRRNRHRGGMFSEAALSALAEEQSRSAEMIDESLSRLSDCLSQLTLAKRRMLEECYSGVHSIQTIAANSGLRPDALYKRLERIRRVLLECMRVGYMKGGNRDD